VITLGYTGAALAAVLFAVVIDLLVLRTRLLTTRVFWATEAIVVFFQLIVNGVLTGFGIVQYDPRVIMGLRLAYAPVEDLGFGFALVTLTLCLWVRLGQRAGDGSRTDSRREQAAG
jgi:lycopene cyclase domain-containing protein